MSGFADVQEAARQALAEVDRLRGLDFEVDRLRAENAKLAKRIAREIESTARAAQQCTELRLAVESWQAWTGAFMLLAVGLIIVIPLLWSASCNN